MGWWWGQGQELAVPQELPQEQDPKQGPEPGPQPYPKPQWCLRPYPGQEPELRQEWPGTGAVSAGSVVLGPRELEPGTEAVAVAGISAIPCTTASWPLEALLPRVADLHLLSPPEEPDPGDRKKSRTGRHPCTACHATTLCSFLRAFTPIRPQITFSSSGRNCPNTTDLPCCLTCSTTSRGATPQPAAPLNHAAAQSPPPPLSAPAPPQ
ncbi:hypothetical protein AAFF_G00432270 [Aldrovandia affinis]|uniref:Uncharacterized protein n=1 Tax=Aldrovandia affinis TaxID=143900 RepID=A0AAD7R556_9TELE|nr:hypothetical protein AAFF_G00432270 [Aldrovandia affinis]